MISCQYCGFSHEVFQPTCAACGAPLRAGQEKVTGKSQAEVMEEIRRLCRQSIILFNVGLFMNGNSIPDKKMQNIKKSFSVFPNGREIFFYCDTTALNNGKQGFMICEDGVYWQNSWLKSTSRNYLPWKTFKERVIVLKHYDLSLGMGDIISLAGIGRKVLFPIIEKLFQRIQLALKESNE
jgi:hypothetical protein